VIALTGVSKVFTLRHARPPTLFDRMFPRERYTYEPLHALRDVTFRIAPGEFVGIVGRNGCGKSTLLRIVAGIYAASAGRVQVDAAVAPLLDLGAGFQSALAVKDNVFLYGVLLGLPRRQLAAELGEILEVAGIPRFADARFDTLSTGMRMRLAFTIAMRSAAAVVLIDEALSVGDEEFQGRCRTELEACRDRGRTGLLVSHDIGTLRALCGRLIVMDAGRVVGDGAPDAMIDLYHALPR
jgi:lipopolysaccharide transport system ATP-binding protein